MSRLLDYYAGDGDVPVRQIEELRLREQPAMVLLFSDEDEEVELHYVADESVKSYVVCPGSGCPECFLGSAPVVASLLPVFDLESRTVKVLRITLSRRQGSLGLELLPFLADPDVSNKALLISRTGPKYFVESRPLQPEADRGQTTIQSFIDSHENGIQLRAAFVSISAAALAETPSIRNKLDVVGGWKPPRADDAPPANTAP